MQDNKSKSTGIIITAVVIVLIGIGAAAYALLRPAPESGSTEKTSTTTTQPSESTSTPADEPDPLLPTIVFTDDGFTQETYNFPAGTAIKVDNQSSMDMQFSSEDHPSHREHPELNMQLLGAGESGTFTPPGAGTYGFHDHINDQFEGTLVIQ